MAGNKQDDILEASMQLFAERGYDGTTVPMIAEKAKVGAGTIYRYFDNKESLVNVLFTKCVSQFAETIQKDFPVNMSIREQFTHIFSRLFAFAKNNPYALLFINSHVNGYYLNQESNKVFNDFLAFITGFIDEGKEQGIIRPLPSTALIAIVYGAFVQVFMTFEKGVLKATPQLLEGVEEACWNAVRID